MRKSLFTVFSTLGLLAVASAAFAQEVTGVSPVAVASAWATAGAMSFAAAVCGIAQGMGLKAACEGTARNPEAGGKLTVTLILGLAFIESLAIYSLVVNLILLFVKPLG
jgi:F-type H+-transporting ATPase subunit c